jgi:hypothetical protein
MTETAYYMVALFGAHYVGDWLCQPRWMAMNKSVSPKVLLQHLSIVTACLYFPTMLYCQLHGQEGMSVLFKLSVNALVHGLIDWNLWKHYKRKVYKLENPKDFKFWEDKSFYDTIGFDQFMHVATLAILFL